MLTDYEKQFLIREIRVYLWLFFRDAFASCKRRRPAGFFVPAARTPAMPGFAFFERKVGRCRQAPNHFPLFIIQLAPRSQAAFATRASITRIHISVNGHYLVVRLTDLFRADDQLILKLIPCFVAK